MKKLLALILALTFVFALAACDAPETYEDDDGESYVSVDVPKKDDEAETPDTSEEEETPVAPEQNEEVQTPGESHSHSYSATVTTPATCERNGVKTFTCDCGHSYTQSIAATGHNCDNWYENFPPLFRVNGEARRDCKLCDYFETQTIPALTTSDDKNENYYRHEQVGGSDGNVDIQLRYVYWEDGKLVAHCYIINRTQYNYDTINPMFMSIRNPETGVLCASGNFPTINKQMPAMQYVEHTFTFSGEAVDNYAADLTTLILTLEF